MNHDFNRFKENIDLVLTGIEQRFDDKFQIAYHRTPRTEIINGPVMWVHVNSRKISKYQILLSHKHNTLIAYDVAVNSEYRREGLGTALNKANEELSKNLEVKELIIKALAYHSSYWGANPEYFKRGLDYVMLVK